MMFHFLSSLSVCVRACVFACVRACVPKYEKFTIRIVIYSPFYQD